MSHPRWLWVICAAFALYTLGSGCVPGRVPPMVDGIAVTAFVFMFALVHGAARYGWRGIFAFVVICLVVSNALENLSIVTGFPFGNYTYTDVLGPFSCGARVVEVARRHGSVLFIRRRTAGAGGHAKVVADALLASGGAELVSFLDDEREVWGWRIRGYPVDGPIAAWSRHAPDAVVVAIGDNAHRKRLFEQLAAAGATFANVVHPRAVVADDVALGRGIVILAGVVVNPGTRIGDNAILNTSAASITTTLLAPMSTARRGPISPALSGSGTAPFSASA